MVVHGVRHDVQLQLPVAGDLGEHVGKIGLRGALLAGGHTVLQVEAHHLVQHGRHVDVHARLHHAVQRKQRTGLFGVAVGLIRAFHASVQAAFRIRRFCRDARQLQRLRVRNAHVVGCLHDDNGNVARHLVQHVLRRMTTLGQRVLVVADGHDHAVFVDAALLDEVAQHVLDVGERTTRRQVGIEQVLRGPR